MEKQYEQRQKSFLHSESIKWCFKKEEEKDELDEEYYTHVNYTYKKIEKYSKKYLKKYIFMNKILDGVEDINQNITDN